MENYNEELYHYGIKGMKWGVRRTAEQLGHVVKGHKTKKKRTEALEKAREVKKTKAEYEAEKQTALKSGKAADILKFKGDLTNEEMRRAVDRLNLEKQLADISARDVRSGVEKVERMIQKANDIGTKGTNLYNTVAKINNSLNDDMELPVIDGTSKKAQKKKKATEKLVNEGSAQDLVDNFANLTLKDLEDANRRLNLEERIREKAEGTKTKKTRTAKHIKRY